MRTPTQETVAQRISGLRALGVPPEILARLGWSDFFVTAHERTDFLAVFLRALAREECTHSWRTMALSCSEMENSELVGHVLGADRKHRPTTVFTYVAQDTAGELVPVSVATVSDRVRADFPFNGFPVLARSFVLPEFRGCGLYPLILNDRLEYCRETWGDGLKAIHLGSADDRVVRTIEGGDHVTPFLYVGDEWLMVADNRSLVRDYLAIGKGFRGDLLEVAKALRVGSTAEAELGAALRTLVTSGANGVSFSTLSSLRQQVDQEMDRDLFAEHPALHEFMSMCASIPIIT
jgi:GNAT superfamily N-acetyltransferase